jgi:hypothetical protein
LNPVELTQVPPGEVHRDDQQERAALALLVELTHDRLDAELEAGAVSAPPIEDRSFKNDDGDALAVGPDIVSQLLVLGFARRGEPAGEWMSL